MKNETNENNENIQEKKMTREECLKILGLPPEADDKTAKQRYGALLRQYKHRTDEKGATYEDLAYYEDISLAYDTLFGFSHDFGDDNPDSLVPYKIRKRWGKFLTVFETYWYAFMLAVIAVVLVTTFVVQRINNGKEDLIIKFVGAYAQDPQVNMVEKINEKSPNFDNVQLTYFTVTTATTMIDYTSRVGAENFRAQLMSPGQLDVCLIDKESFDVYVQQGVFVALDDYLTEYLAAHNVQSTLGMYSYQSEPDEDGNVKVPEGVYGIEVSETNYFEGIGLQWLYDESKSQEKTMVFAITTNSKRPDKAWLFAEELLGGIYENSAD